MPEELREALAVAILLYEDQLFDPELPSLWKQECKRHKKTIEQVLNRSPAGDFFLSAINPGERWRRENRII